MNHCKKLAPTASYQAALVDPANADFAASLQQANAGGDPSAAFGGLLENSSALSTLDPTLARPFLVGFSGAMDLVFICGAAVMVLCFLVLLRLPEVPLRSGSAYSERADEDAAARAAGATPSAGTAPLNGGPAPQTARPGDYTQTPSPDVARQKRLPTIAKEL